MKISIRKFLLLNLLMAITLTTTLTAIGNYYLDQRDIQEHLDSLMAISAMSAQALLGDDVDQRHLPAIQANLSHIPQKLKHYFMHLPSSDVSPSLLSDRFNFQVWGDSGRLLLHSARAKPLAPTNKYDGFSDQSVDGQRWRLFSTYNQQTGIRTVLAERYNARSQLGYRIALDDLYIMLLTFPLSGLLIWIVIGKGLNSLDTVAREVAFRAPSQLEPLDLQSVPQEIRPVILELNKLFSRLQQAFDREKRFAADAAHELKTPLAALKAHAQVAAKTKIAEERQDALQKLMLGVDRSSHTVQQLLTMSRLLPDSGFISNQTQVNLVKIAVEVIAALANQAVEKQIDLAFDCTLKRLFIPGDNTAITILIRNLLDNAIRYTEQGGKVTLSLHQTPKLACLTVTDNGPGIPDTLRNRVFERFFRVLGNKSPGSGLGLSIVAEIASLHRAEVSMDNASSGKGLQITVRFPKNLDEPATAATKS